MNNLDLKMRQNKEDDPKAKFTVSENKQPRLSNWTRPIQTAKVKGIEKFLKP